MSKKVLILSGSPRRGGNSDTLCDEFMRGAEDTGNTVVKVFLGDYKINYCTGCGVCNGTHQCVQKDDMAEILDKVDNADMIVFASPIYWFSISAQLKAAIDRLYARAKKGFNIRYAALLLDSASDGVYRSAVAAYEDTCSYLRWENKGILTVPGMDAKGDMEHSDGVEKAYRLGKSLVSE